MSDNLKKKFGLDGIFEENNKGFFDINELKKQHEQNVKNRNKVQYENVTVISPLYGSSDNPDKIEMATDYSENNSITNHSVNKGYKSIDDYKTQNFLNNKPILSKTLSSSITNIKTTNTNLYQQNQPVTNQIIQPRKEKATIFGENEQELTQQLDHLKSKISNNKEQKNYLNNQYDQTSLYIDEEEREDNRKFLKVINDKPSIEDNFSENMSLQDLRKQIYNNSAVAETQRANKLMKMREMGLENKFLKRSDLNVSKQSEYHKVLDNLRTGKSEANVKQVSDYYFKRNPYFQRMLEIEEQARNEEIERRKLRGNKLVDENEEDS